MSREEEKKLLEEFKARQFADNSKELIEVIREDEDMEEALICLLMDDWEGNEDGESKWLKRLRRDVHKHLSQKFADSIVDDDDEEFDPSIGWRVWE